MRLQRAIVKRAEPLVPGHFQIAVIHLEIAVVHLVVKSSQRQIGLFTKKQLLIAGVRRGGPQIDRCCIMKRMCRGCAGKIEMNEHR